MNIAPNINPLRKFNLLIGGLIVVLGLANLLATNTLATQGVVLNHLSQQTNLLMQKNQELENKLHELRSLAKIESRAQQLGFTRIHQITTITPPDLAAAMQAE